MRHAELGCRVRGVRAREPESGADWSTPSSEAACCLAAVVGYHDAGKTAEAFAAMAADLGGVVARCGDQGLTPSEFVTLVLYPPGKCLAARFGPDHGGRLLVALLTAFLAATVTAGDPAPV